MLQPLKSVVKNILPTPVHDSLRLARWNWFGNDDLKACHSFVVSPSISMSRHERLEMIDKLYAINRNVPNVHTQREMLQCIEAILASAGDGGGVIVEAGCFKGGGTSKFSLAAAIAGKQLVVFDSFAGLPKHDEKHESTIFGDRIEFYPGQYKGELEEVKANVAKNGRIDHCRFVKGWFDDTLPHFHEPVSVAYLDVDLVTSTRTCLKYLYPLIRPGGTLFSQDGQVPLVIELLDNDQFWQDEIGCPKPKIQGLRKNKLLKIVKDA